MATGLTDGFDHHYRPEDSRVREAFESGLIVLDTNVLLNVLRYSPVAREELMQVLGGIADRCFVPHQVAVEYNRNRVRVVSDRHKELEEAAAEIGSIRSKVQAVVNNIRHRRTLASEDIHLLEGSVTTFFSALQRASNDAADLYDLDPDHMVGAKDPWTAQLDRLLTGRVGEKPSDEDLAQDVAEAERRKAERLAPGFKDDGPGDYLWWAEVLRHPELKGRPLLVVSDDAAKGDWRFEERGITVGPQPILVEDLRLAGGLDLILLTTRDLLQLVEAITPNRVSAETIEESEKVLVARHSPWTFDAYTELLDTLDGEGYGDRTQAIETAAQNGGFATRDDIYKVLGQDEEARSLRHFATPVQRVARGLIEEGLLSPHAISPLEAEYDGPGKTIGYSTPPEFVEFHERRAQDHARASLSYVESEVSSTDL